MDNISVPSRFSCLKIEDEGTISACNKLKKKPENKQNGKKNNLIQQANNVKKSGPRQNGTSDGPSKSSSRKNKAKAKHDDKQWEDWKKKDEEYVDENFEQDLQCALFQSKLDFETQKNSVSVVITTQDKNKKKKSKTMTLDQFLDNKKEEPNKGKIKDIQGDGDGNENFFQKAISSAKQELNREKVEEQRRERSNNIEEVISLVQYQEKLEKEKEKNEQLQKELEEAKKEIVIVKKRNKTLCNMLSQGEMKDKAQVLLELEKLTRVKEELTEEVTRLHKLLEQERSSPKANTTNNPDTTTSQKSRHKEKIKKKNK